MSYEEKRQEVIALVKAKVLAQSEAATILGIGIRQVKRLCRALREQGSTGLISKKQGRPATNRVPDEIKQQVITHAQSKYVDFGPTFMAEKLKELDNIDLSKETIRKILIDAGLWKGKKTKKNSIHQRRERRACFGELVQIDGSPHAWFEKRGPACCLILFVDDATSNVLYAKLEPVETTAAYFKGMTAHIKTYGIPLAYYSDKHMIFRVGNAKTAETDLTQFERACSELGIEGICANSPQAKGRIERQNRTFQDRLVKEFRLAGINTIEGGNKFLETYIPKHNNKFSVCARKSEDVHVREIPDDETLAHILSIQSERKLSKNLEVSFKNTIYQILVEGRGRCLQNSIVTVCQMLNGDFHLLSSKGDILHYKTLQTRTKAGGTIVDDKSLNAHIDALMQRKKITKPALDHPWRKYNITPPKSHLPQPVALA